MKKVTPIQLGMVATRPPIKRRLSGRAYSVTRQLAYFWTGQAAITRKDTIDAWVNTIGAVGTGAGLIGSIVQTILR